MAGVDENGLDGVTTALITEPVQNPIEQCKNEFIVNI